MSCDVGEVTERLENEFCLRHGSFSNPSVASPTSQFILQPFFRLSYVTSSSLNSPGEPRAHEACKPRNIIFPIISKILLSNSQQKSPLKDFQFVRSKARNYMKFNVSNYWSENKNTQVYSHFKMFLM